MEFNYTNAICITPNFTNKYFIKINIGNLKSSFIYTQKLIKYLIWSFLLISSS